MFALNPLAASQQCVLPAWVTLSNGLSLATLIVLFFTARAAFSQSRAADRQAKAAEQLTAATNEQIATSKLQAEAARRGLVEAVRPILLLQGEGSGSGTSRDATVVNDGTGPALDIRWFYGTLPENGKEFRDFDLNILGAKQDRRWQYNWELATKQGLTFTYTSLTGSKNATQIAWKNGSMHMDYLQDI